MKRLKMNSITKQKMNQQGLQNLRTYLSISIVFHYILKKVKHLMQLTSS